MLDVKMWSCHAGAVLGCRLRCRLTSCKRRMGRIYSPDLERFFARTVRGFAWSPPVSTGGEPQHRCRWIGQHMNGVRAIRASKWGPHMAGSGQFQMAANKHEP